jgi:hypothetical protein
MLRDDMPRVLAAAAKRGFDSPSEAELLQVARSLTWADNSAMVGSTMLLFDMPRVLAEAAKRGIDATSQAALLQFATSLTNEDNAAKTGSTMTENEPDRVHTKATTLGVDVGDDNALRHVAKCLQLVENRWKGHFGDTVIAYFQYKKDRGHFPAARGDNPQLGKWAEKLRGLKRKFDRGEPAQGMCSERVSMLTALGFPWNPPMHRK